MREVILEAHNLKKSFGRRHTLVKAIDDISLSLHKGELVLVMGPSGSGKTTLITLLAGFLRPKSGKIILDGIDTTRLAENRLTKVRREKIGFIFQAFNLLSSLSVEENVMVPLLLRAYSKSEARDKAHEVLKRLGMERKYLNYPKDLSGGEKQRVAIARAVITNPPLLLADEPTANLDSTNGAEVMKLLKEFAVEQNKTVVVVSHDPRIVEIADKVITIENGKLVKLPKTQA